MRAILIGGGVLIVCGAIGGLVFFGMREHQRVSAVDREIAALRHEAETLENHNATLEARIAYFSSDAYKERMAKERLGYRHADEHVVVVVPSADAERTSESQDTAPQDSVQTVQETPHSLRARIAAWWSRFWHTTE